jgi:hypothetical protein
VEVHHRGDDGDGEEHTVPDNDAPAVRLSWRHSCPDRMRGGTFRMPSW